MAGVWRGELTGSRLGPGQPPLLGTDFSAALLTAAAQPEQAGPSIYRATGSHHTGQQGWQHQQHSNTSVAGSLTDSPDSSSRTSSAVIIIMWRPRPTTASTEPTNHKIGGIFHSISNASTESRAGVLLLRNFPVYSHGFVINWCVSSLQL